MPRLCLYLRFVASALAKAKLEELQVQDVLLVALALNLSLSHSIATA